MSKGIDPATEKKEKRHAATVTDLCDQYIEYAEDGRLLTRRGIAKKPSNLLTDRGRIAWHIKPLTREDLKATGNDQRRLWIPTNLRAIEVALAGRAAPRP